ncbi:cyclic phosphodiesterase-like protein-domain-containing protein [Armillaria mellea]|nr:cyclic phosphodiesterase-like protein-domain-containing protein [Armillaria mellea]
MGYAVWLVPSSTESAALSELMSFRPKTYTQDSQSCSYPSFYPHITLATFDDLPSPFNLDSISLDNLAPPVAHFDSVKRGNSYLGALSIVISPVNELMPLRDAVTAHLDMLNTRWKSRGFPHMSLFYVDEPDERDHLYTELIGSRRIHEDGCLTLTANPLTQVKTFTGSEIWLVDCTRSVKRWDVIAKRYLVSPAPPPPKETVPQTQTNKNIRTRHHKKSLPEPPAVPSEPPHRRHTSPN